VVARAGILIRDADALQRLETIDTLIFDKTGTLTEGKPSLTDVVAASGTSEQELLHFAASADQPSQHPLAEAIVTGARRRGDSAGEFRFDTGARRRGSGGRPPRSDRQQEIDGPGKNRAGRSGRACEHARV
jgi:cation transport ATPase